MLRRFFRATLMVLSIPFVMVAVALGWRPKRSSDESTPPVRRTGRPPYEAAHIAVRKFTSLLDDGADVPREHVERLADHLLAVELELLAEAELPDVLSCAEHEEHDVVGVRQRALGLALVAWGRSGADARSLRAVELGRSCLAVGLASAPVLPPQPSDLPSTQPRTIG